MCYDDDDDDDDDDDFTLLIAHFREILPVVTKMHLDARKQAKYEMVRPAVPYQSVRETVLARCGIPSRITCNRITPDICTCIYIHVYIDHIRV